jgi:hypothetical protein
VFLSCRIISKTFNPPTGDLCVGNHLHYE